MEFEYEYPKSPVRMRALFDFYEDLHVRQADAFFSDIYSSSRLPSPTERPDVGVNSDTLNLFNGLPGASQQSRSLDVWVSKFLDSESCSDTDTNDLEAMDVDEANSKKSTQSSSSAEKEVYSQCEKHDLKTRLKILLRLQEVVSCASVWADHMGYPALAHLYRRKLDALIAVGVATKNALPPNTTDGAGPRKVGRDCLSRGTNDEAGNSARKPISDKGKGKAKEPDRDGNRAPKRDILKQKSNQTRAPARPDSQRGQHEERGRAGITSRRARNSERNRGSNHSNRSRSRRR